MGGGIHLPLTGLTLPTDCVVLVSDFSTPPPPATNPTGLASLTVRLELPAVVQAGSELVHVVDLSNPTGQSVALTPCPSYTEQVGSQSYSLQLSCSLVPSIGTGTVLRFVMKAPISQNQAHGDMKISWYLNLPASSLGGGIVQVH
jgi:hypothetical protein